ncbi:Protein of unknown function [Gryllus bimaculatus]|nr:Protein of unknown function [Gryllus bimaculatus]
MMGVDLGIFLSMGLPMRRRRYSGGSSQERAGLGISSATRTLTCNNTESRLSDSGFDSKLNDTDEVFLRALSPVLGASKDEASVAVQRRRTGPRPGLLLLLLLLVIVVVAVALVEAELRPVVVQGRAPALEEKVAGWRRRGARVQRHLHHAERLGRGGRERGEKRKSHERRAAAAATTTPPPAAAATAATEEDGRGGAPGVGVTRSRSNALGKASPSRDDPADEASSPSSPSPSSSPSPAACAACSSGNVSSLGSSESLPGERARAGWYTSGRGPALATLPAPLALRRAPFVARESNISDNESKRSKELSCKSWCNRKRLEAHLSALETRMWAMSW